jgi:large subunit ribosomal protein L32
MTFPTLTACPNPACGKLKRPHAACGYCGYYDGVMVVEVKAEAKKKG